MIASEHATKPGLHPSAVGSNKLALWLFLLFAWFSQLVFPSRLPIPTLDPSWQAVLNYAAVHNLQFGSELVFTYGPLGYLAQNQYCSGTWLAVVLFQAASRAIYLALIWRLAASLPQDRPGGGLTGLLAFASAALLPALDGDSFYLLFITFLGVRMCSTAQIGWLEIAGTVALAVLGQIKGTYLAFEGVALCCASLWCLANSRPLRAVLLLAGFAFAFSLSWLFLAHQQLANLPAWLRSTLELTRGYQLAMGIMPDLNQLACGIAAFVLVLGVVVVALGRSRGALPAILLVLCGVFLAWKQGFTRGDEFHTRTFFIYVLVAAVAFPRLTGFELPRILLIFLVGLSVGSSLLVRLPLPLYRAFENARFLLRLPRMNNLWAEQARDYQLPLIKAIVGSSSVDVTGAEQGIAILNGFNYHPAPVFQTYAAATSYLAQLNADFYRSERAPDFILVSREYRLDNRLPNLDESLSGLVIAQRYRQVAVEKGYRLLQRVAQPQEFPPPKTSSEAYVGERLPVQGGEWCQIVMKENFLGRLTRFLWASPPVWVEVWRGDEEPLRYRFVPSMAETGFVIPDGVVAMAVDKTPASRLCFRPRLSCKLYQPPKAPVEAAPPNDGSK